jgi:hypothetical protein
MGSQIWEHKMMSLREHGQMEAKDREIVSIYASNQVREGPNFQKRVSLMIYLTFHLPKRKPI